MYANNFNTQRREICYHFNIPYLSGRKTYDLFKDLILQLTLVGHHFEIKAETSNKKDKLLDVEFKFKNKWHSIKADFLGYEAYLQIVESIYLNYVYDHIEHRLDQLFEKFDLSEDFKKNEFPTIKSNMKKEIQDSLALDQDHSSSWNFPAKKNSFQLTYSVVFHELRDLKITRTQVAE